ncbi:MAG: hypothetical protein ACOC2N_03815, partial [Spirochaetota bacterium]
GGTMNLDWRTGAVAAAAALILSLLAGIVGGVSFGALLFRAIMGAVVFGAGAIGISILIDRYLPELKTAVDETSGGIPDDSPGGRVDITVDDSSDPAVESSFMLEDGDEDDFVPGIAADEVHAGVDAGAADAGDEIDEGDEDEVAELEEAGDADEEQDSGGSASESVPETGSAHSLPDIEGFSGSFAEAPSEVEEVEGAQRSGEDPGIMARAIRTVLKREE